ncbi:MAG: hypothetical protein U0521_16335 [Anaerolineae bacterium]
MDTNGDGVREKYGMPLELTISYSNILQHFETTALVAQDELQKIGFKINLDLVEWANYIDQIYYGQMYDITPMSNSGGTNTPDPNDFMTLLMSKEDVPGSGNNLASYVNPEIDDLIQQARTVPGCAPEDRAAIYYQIQQKAHDDVAYNFTYVPSVFPGGEQPRGQLQPRSGVGVLRLHRLHQRLDAGKLTQVTDCSCRGARRCARSSSIKNQERRGDKLRASLDSRHHSRQVMSRT